MKSEDCFRKNLEEGVIRRKRRLPQIVFEFNLRYLRSLCIVFEIFGKGIIHPQNAQITADGFWIKSVLSAESADYFRKSQDCVDCRILCRIKYTHSKVIDSFGCNSTIVDTGDSRGENPL